MEVEERRRDLQEDGWGDLFDKRRPIWRKLLKFPFRVAKKVLQATKEPGTLILVRHGESEWNANKTFTGWADPDLSTQGYREVEYAARYVPIGRTIVNEEKYACMCAPVGVSSSCRHISLHSQLSAQ